MAGNDEPVFLRPVIIDTTNKDFTIGSAGAPVACALTQGTYPNVAAVLNEMHTKVDAGLVDVIVDGDMEAVGVGAWTSFDSALTKQGAAHGGAQCLRVTSVLGVGLKYPDAEQAILTAGKSYLIDGYARSDGTQLPRVGGGGLYWAGTVDTNWQHFNLIITAFAGNFGLYFQLNNPAGTEYVEFDDINVWNITDGCPVDFAPSFTSDFLVKLDATTDFVLTWTDSALRDLLGFTGTLTGDNTYTATYTPENCWVPSRSRADNNEWEADHKIEWKGVESRTGNVCGLTTGTAIYRTTFDFDALLGAEIHKSYSTSAIEQVRSLDYFVSQCRSVWGAIDAPSPSGFYLYPDRDDVTCAASATWDSGDASKMLYSSSPETFVFCQFDADWYPDGKPAISHCRTDYFSVTVRVHNAVAPTWTGA